MNPSAVALAGALALDVVVGEPPERLHPVAWFGRVAAVVDGEWHHPRAVGAAAALVLPVVAGTAVGGTVLVADAASPLAGALVASVAVFVTTSCRRLLARVREVVAATEGDLDAARERLRALAGRDTAGLSAGEIRSAAVESLAENYADGLVGPLAGYAVLAVAASVAGASPVGAVAAGCGGAAWVKAVNTLDSMLGYRSKPTGWGPARLDDAVMWLPARAGALLLAVALARLGALARARRWQAAVDSPNSGWPMGTMAAGLNVRLTKPGHYDIHADAPLPDAATANVALQRVAVASVAAYALAGVVTWG